MSDKEKLIDVPARPQSVPAWFYEEDGWCGLTKAAFLWWANGLAFSMHLTLAVASVIVATLDGKTMATPLLTVYLTNLTWVANSTDALIPRNQAADGLYLAHMVLWFFLLSALAHGTIMAFNYRQAFAVNDTEARAITRWTGWYYLWIHECRNPARWFEYAFSASLMGMVFAVAGGVAHLYMVLMIFGLLWSTMFFGYHAEVVCRPVDLGPDKRAKYWQMNNENPQLLAFPELGARINRLAPNCLGYVPYSFVWGPLLHSFFFNVAGAEQGPPSFVYVIIISQLLLFSCFGFTQFVSLWREDGPSFFYWSEFSYQVLSVLAKGVLGLVLMVNVLLFDSFDDAVADAS